MNENFSSNDRKVKIQRLLLQYLEEGSTIGISNLEKCISMFEPISLDEYQACSSEIINQLTLSTTEVKLRKVSQLLEKRFGRCFVQFATSFIVSKTNDILNLWIQNNVDINQNQVHLAIRIILQIIQYIWDEEKLTNLNINEMLVDETEDALLSIIGDNDCLIENVMLAGTCLIRLLHTRFSNLELVARRFISLLTETNDQCSRKLFTRLVLLNGFLNCGHQTFLSLKIERIPLLLLILPLILRLCQDNSNYTFQCFQMLLSWLATVKKWLPESQYKNLDNDYLEETIILVQNAELSKTEGDLIVELRQWWQNETKESFVNDLTPTNRSHSNKYLFQSSSRVFFELYNIISVNWENFTRGVPDLIRECFVTLLELHLKESELLEINSGDLIEVLILHQMKMPWTVKGKYPPLSILISYYGITKLLRQFPNLPSQLTETLFSNPLASAGADTYRAALRQLSKEEKNENLLISTWQEAWALPIQKALESNNEIVQQNIFRHWLPCTLTIVPATYDCLIKYFSLSKLSYYQNALMTVMKQARQMGLVNFDMMDINLILEALFHLDENIRIQALALLCCNHKKAEPISDKEVELINEFILYNMNIDSAPFRQQLVNHMKSILVRVRDSCISLITQEKKSGYEVKNNQLQKSLEFVDDLVNLVIDHLSPGANFQRHQTCLELFQLILDTFAAPPNSQKRKGGVPDKAPLVMEYARKRNLWNFTSDNIFQRLLNCLHDFMSEIKLLAVEILNKYFCDQELLQNEATVSLMQRKSQEWLYSPKAHVCESGALLVNFIFNRVTVMKNAKVCATDHLQNLTALLQEQFQIAQHDMFLAAKKYPMHGTILALHLFISDSNWIDSALDYSKLASAVELLIGVTIKLIDYVLSVLASKSNSNSSAPSFADMGNAIDGILDASGVNNDEDNPALSLEHQLILSCCWLTLKECSFLLSKLVTKMPLQYQSNQGVLSVFLAQRVCDVLVSILIRCRHRGAIEACSIAIGEVCKTLSSQQLSQFREIPKTILKSVLEVVESTDSAASITRRSAGLPLLVAAVISNETNLRNCTLLDETIHRLLRIASTPLTVTQSDTVDLPQTHALHMLRALLHDSNLAQVILPYVVRCVKLCIDNFSSSSWAIRNASLQLYGSLVPRLLGQKKVRDEHSQHNSITAQVLFHRYPELKEFLLDTLKQMINNRNPAHLGLVPILSLLSKLTPAYNDGQTDRISDEFSTLLQFFIGSPLYIIRKLTADAFVATSSTTKQDCMMNVVQNLTKNANHVNYVHGNLLIISKILLLNGELTDNVRQKLEEIYTVFENKSDASFLVRAIILTILIEQKDDSPFLKRLFDRFLQNEIEDDCNSWQPGIIEWKKEMISLALKRSSDSQLKLLIKRFINGTNQDQILSCLHFLKMKIVDDMTTDLNLCIQERLIILLCSSPHPCYVQLSLDLLLNLMTLKNSTPCHSSLVSDDSLQFFQNAVNGFYGTLAAASATVVLGFILTTCNQTITDTNVTKLLGIWCKHIYDHSDPMQAEDLRLKAAEALRLVGCVIIKRISLIQTEERNEYVLHLFGSGVKLLTDESGQVRNIAAEFAALLPRSSCFYQFSSIHPNYGLHLFLNYFSSEFGQLLLTSNILWDKLHNYPSSCNLLQQLMSKDRNFILFEQDDVNIYAEQYELVKIYSTLIQTLMTDNLKLPFIKSWLQTKAACALADARDAIKLISESSHTSDFPCLSIFASSKPRLILYKLTSQIKILLLLKLLDQSQVKEFEIISSQLRKIVP